METNIFQKYPAAINILLLIKEGTATKIFKKEDLTYGYIIKLINILEKEELIIKEKIGQKNMLSLTEKGKQIEKVLLNLQETMRG